MLHCNKKYHDFPWENKDYSMTTINTIFAFRTILRTHWPVILPKLTVTKGIVINKMASTSLQFHQTGYNLGSFFKDISQILHTTVWGLCKYYANTHFPDLFLKWQHSMNFLNSLNSSIFHESMYPLLMKMEAAFYEKNSQETASYLLPGNDQKLPKSNDPEETLSA